MDDGYETGTTTASSTAAPSTKSRSPQRSSSCSSATGPPHRPPLTHKRSVGGGSLPSPAHITDEARRVLEAFLQRSLSTDRGSISSVAAMLPRHLEVIEEIRHTRIRSDSYRNATVDSGASPSPMPHPASAVTFAPPPVVQLATPEDDLDDTDEIDDCVDGVSVTARLVAPDPQLPPVVITDMEVEHQHVPGQPHATDIDLHLRTAGVNGEMRVHTHLIHPALSERQHESGGAAAAVTTGAAEVFMDATLSRQQSQVDAEMSSVASPGVLTVPSDGRSTVMTPLSRAYEADGERATPGLSVPGDADEAAAMDAKQKKKKKKLSRESIRSWLRNLRQRTSDEAVRTPDAEVDGYADEYQRFIAQRPKFQTMESTSSTTSTSTFGDGSGATARSIIHRGDDVPPKKRKKRRLRRRSSYAKKQRDEEGQTFFHQLFNLKFRRPRDNAASAPSVVESGLHRNSSLINDMLANQELLRQQASAIGTTAGSPESDQMPDGVAEAFSMPELTTHSHLREQEEVGEMFRSAIEKRNSSGSGIRMEATSSAVVRRLPSGGDDVDATRPVASTTTKQVDRTTLRLDLGSSSASQSSNSQSQGGAGALSSPDGLGPDGVARSSDVDRVARLLDKLADEINSDLAGLRKRSDSTPSAATEKRRLSLPDNNPFRGRGGPLHRSRPGSARGRSGVSESSVGECTVTASASSPQLLNGDGFDAQRALRAKAHRIKHQSSECLVSDNLLECLQDCNSYEEYADIVRKWLGHLATGWKKIALLYHMARKLVRRTEKESEASEERVDAIKNYTMRFFQENFAEFVIRRGGWQNVIEDTEDSELD